MDEDSASSSSSQEGTTSWINPTPSLVLCFICCSLPCVSRSTLCQHIPLVFLLLPIQLVVQRMPRSFRCPEHCSCDVDCTGPFCGRHVGLRLPCFYFVLRARRFLRRLRVNLRDKLLRFTCHLLQEKTRLENSPQKECEKIKIVSGVPLKLSSVTGNVHWFCENCWFFSGLEICSILRV